MKRISSVSRWWWITLLVVGGSAYLANRLPTWMNMRGPLYESTALIEITPESGVLVNVSGVGQPTLVTTGAGVPPQLNSGDYSKADIKSPRVMYRVLVDHYLSARLGENDGMAFLALKQLTAVEPRNGTDLLELHCRHEDPQMAHDLVVALCKAYRSIRTEDRLRKRKAHLKNIKAELQIQSESVLILRNSLMDLYEKRGVTHCGPGDQAQLDKGEVVEIQIQARKELQDSENELKKLADQISVCPNEEIKAKGVLKQRHQILKRRIQAMREVLKGVDPNSPRGQFQKKLDEVRREYENAIKVRDEIGLRYDIAKTSGPCFPATGIMVHEAPTISKRPITRGRMFYSIVGPLLSIPISLGLIYLFLGYIERMFPPEANIAL